MRHFFQTVRNQTGAILPGATVNVYLTGTLTPAVLYSDDGITVKGNPLTTDSLGRYDFYVADGRYDIVISGTLLTTYTQTNVEIADVTEVALSDSGWQTNSLSFKNQPGSLTNPATGEVVIFSKVDKHLYLRDDAGTETDLTSGGGGSGLLILNNTFTGTNNFDNDVHFKGPNPEYDFLRNGGYIGSNTATGSITSGSPTLTLVSNPDFQNGQGVFVPGAGSLPTIPAAPAIGSIVNVGLSGGSTQYEYCFAPEDYFGGVRACGASASTATGQATLGVNSQSITSISRVSGLDTLTCSANCNVLAGAEMQISGFAGANVALTNGTVIAAANSSGTSVTVNANGLPDYSESAAATLSVNACNEVRAAGLLSQESTVLRTWVYRRDGGVGNFTVKGVIPGQDGYFRDCGQGLSGVPSYVPNIAPVADIPGYLATTIASGGGTTSLTLAANAGTTVAAATIQHDNSPALKALYVAMLGSTNGGEITLPYISPATSFVFNSTLDFSSVSNPTGKTSRIKIVSASLNQPWVLGFGMELLGQPIASQSFQPLPLGGISGASHPLLFMNARSKGSVSLKKLKIQSTAISAPAFLTDHNLTGGGVTNVDVKDCAFSAVNASAVMFRGGFGFNFSGTVFSVLGTLSGTFSQPPAARFTNASSYLGTTTLQVAGLSNWSNIEFSGGTSVQFDNLPAANLSSVITNGGPSFTLTNVLAESNAGPVVRVLLPNGAFGVELSITNVAVADPANGGHQPILEMGTSSNVIGVNLVGNFPAVGGGPAILGGTTRLGATCIGNTASGCGPVPNLAIAGPTSYVNGGIMGAQGGGSIGYLMPTPAAPASCVVSAGGSVPITTGLQYAIVAADRTPITFSPFAGLTVLGPACTVTTSGGNQTVTITRPALPAGATGWMVWRGNAMANIGGCVTPIPASTTTFVDTFSFTCGVSAPSYTTAFTSGINSSGINTNKLMLSAETLSAVPRSEQTAFLPGALTSTWTGATWTLDKAITVTRVQVQTKTAPVTCTPNAVVRVTDGSTPIDTTIAAAANDSGAISQNYAAGAVLTIAVQTAAAGCGTSPADANVVVQYKNQ